MTLLEYAFKLCDEKLAALKVVEDRLVTLHREVMTEDLKADLRRLTIDYADQRRRLLQQKQYLLDEATAYYALRQGHETWTLVH